jgi:DNA-binding response OmpR family regulator
MVQIENPESSVVQRRKILLVGVEPSLQGWISTFLVAMGWAWTVVYDVEQAFGLSQREAFDALLIDLGRLESNAEDHPGN